MYGTFFGRRNRVSATPRGVTSAPGEAPFRYTVQKGDNFASIAKATNSSVEDIRRLNPEVRKRDLYPGQSLIVDEPTSVSLPPPPDLIDDGWGQMHVVRPHDTLSSIADEYNTTESAIRNGNRHYFPVGERGLIFPGQLLVIRMVNTTDSETAFERLQNNPPKGYLFHEVTSNDTFEKICLKYGISYSYLIQMNPTYFPVGSRADLQEGQRLLISNSALEQQPHQQDEASHIGEIKLTKMIHVVMNNDCIEKLLQKYQMSLEELRDMNRSYFPRGYRGEIKAGMKLVVKRTNAAC